MGRVSSFLDNLDLKRVCFHPDLENGLMSLKAVPKGTVIQSNYKPSSCTIWSLDIQLQAGVSVGFYVNLSVLERL
jgi:hypothetical protein